MKTKLSLAGVCLLLTLITFGQTVPFPTHTDNDNTVPFPEKMDDVFGNLDLTDVTTNLLLDRAWPFAKPADFDGTQGADTVKSHKHWLKLYGTMATAATSQPAPIPSINDWRAQRDAEEENGKNPLVIVHADYHRIKRDSALIYSLFYEQNGELYDAPNQSTSPYEAQTLFAFSPYKTTLYDSLSMDFRTSPAFFKTNTGLTVSTVEFDFDDGQGWRTVGVNATTKVSWSTFGKKQLKLRLTYTNNQVFYGYSTLNLVQSPHYNPSGAKNYNEWWSGYQHIDHPDPALSDYGINLQIEYACGNDKILKPFIYVEGFSPHEYFEGFENETYIDFWDDFNLYQDDNDAGYPLLDELEANGYDIIYVDFEQGTGNILENAQTLKKAIKWVNDQKAANCSSEPNVVAGYSMGGLVARLALRQMELDPAYGEHDVSYFITVDTPHLGANIPFGIAIAVDDLYRTLITPDDGLGQYEEGLANAYELLNSPAASQMLFYAFDFQPISIPFFVLDSYVLKQARIDFVNELNIGLPELTVENVAIAKGNGVGASQGFTGVAELISINAFNDYSCFDNLVNTYDLFDGHTFGNTLINGFIGGVIDILWLGGFTGGVILDINALPGGNEQYEIYGRKIQFQALYGLININTGSKHVKAYGIPFDSAPGGTYDINAVSGTGGSAQFFQDVLDGDYEPCLEVHQSQFGFVPTVSALNIPGKVATPFSPIDPATTVSNGETPFDKVFILDPTVYPLNTAPTNEAHVELTPSNVGPFEEYISVDYNQVNTDASVYGYTFNFGGATVNNETVKTTDRITHNLDVTGLSSSSAGLWINKNARLSDINNTNNPISQTAHFNLELTESCDGTYGRVSVGEYASIIIGENATKTAQVIIRDNAWIDLDGGEIVINENSKLIVDNGGELRLVNGTIKVMNGGEILIKEGGRLVYEDGAILELNGNDAVLALQGLLHVGNDATFGFSYQGNESGYIKILFGELFGDASRFSAGTNARVDLQGENDDDLILYLENWTTFSEFDTGVAVIGQNYLGNRFASCKFSYGRIAMESGARMVTLPKTEFHYIKTEPATSDAEPKGLIPLNTCIIMNSTIDRVPIDANLQWFGSGELHIYHSDLFNSHVSVTGMGYKVQDCNFNNTDISSSEGSNMRSIRSSNFVASEIWDYTSAELLISLSVMQGKGIQKANGRITARCTEFTGSTIAIYGRYNAEINLSTLYNGGYNHFHDNDYNIRVKNAAGILMEDGYNQFYDGNIMNINGSLNHSIVGCQALNAERNTWTPGPDINNTDNFHPDPLKFHVIVTAPLPIPYTVCQLPFYFGLVSPIARCGEHNGPLVPEPWPITKSNDIAIYPSITTDTHFIDEPFDTAIRNIAYTTTEADTLNGDDLLAADMYHEFLLASTDSVSDSLETVINHMHWAAIGNYKATIERLTSDSVLNIQNNVITFESTIQDYVDVLMHYTDSVKTPENYQVQFGLEMDKVALFKLLQNYEKAYEILVNIDYCEHDSIQRLILDSQMRLSEHILMAQEFNALQLIMDSTELQLDSAIYTISSANIIDTTGFGSYIQSPTSILYSSCTAPSASIKHNGNSDNYADISFELYPNPASDEITLSIIEGNLPKGKQPIRLSLYDMTGRMVLETSLTNYTQSVSIGTLPPALYLYSISLNDRNLDQGRFVIIK